MQRTITWALVTLLIVAGIVIAGSVVARRLAPARLEDETERWLSEWMGTPVEIARARPVFHRGLALELSEVRSTGWPEGPGLHAREARLALDLRGLLFGGSPVRGVWLGETELRARRDASGAWHPPGVQRLIGAGAGGEEPQTSWWERLEQGATALVRILVHRPPALPSITVERARLEIQLTRPGAAVDAGAETIAVDDLRVRLVRRLFGAGLRFEGTGRVATGEGIGGELHAQGEIETRDSLDLEISAEALDLRLLRGILERGMPRSTLVGQGEGSIRWRAQQGGSHRFDGRLRVAAPRLRIAGAGGASPPVELAAPEAEVGFDLAVDPGALRLLDGSVRAGGSEIRLGGRVELPIAETARALVAIRAWGIPVAPVREVALALLPDGRHPASGLLRTLEDGAFDFVSLTCPELSLGHWRALGSLEPARWPPALRVEVAVRDVSARLPSEQRVTHLAGRFVATPRSLEVHATGGELDGVPLARLDLMLEGLEHIQLPERPALPAVGALPGRMPLGAWVNERHRPGSSSWRRATLELEWLRHPLLFRELRDAEIVLTPLEEGLHAAVTRGRWAGIPVSGEVGVAWGEPGALAVALRAEAPGPSGSAGADEGNDAPPAPAESRPADGATPPPADGASGVPAGTWARGRLDVELNRLGQLEAERLEGSLVARGDRIDLEDAHATLRPRGLLQGQLRLDLSRPDEVPVRVQLQLQDGSLAHVLDGIGVADSGLEGDVVAAGILQGTLRPTTPLLGGLQGRIGAHARNGVLRRKLPIILALASASDTLNPFPSREKVAYRALDAELEVDRGTVRALSLSLDGPTLRLVATGRIDAVDPERPLEAVVGVFFFRKLDAVINRVPVLNRLLLGSNENFVAAYFALDGPWAKPRARFIPLKSLTAGPGSVVIGLPGFVGSNLQRLQSLIVGGWRVGGESAPPEGPP